MNESIVSSLKLVYNPLVMYYGQWELGSDMFDLALVKKDKNLFAEFLERYYYTPLKVIFKEDSLVNSFKYVICSKLTNEGRGLYFSKKAFFANIISNFDEMVDSCGKDVYKQLKKEIRIKKDSYRDVFKNGERSLYYNDVKKEYIECDLDIQFEDFVLLCKKKYTRLLSGYNTLLDFFDKPLDTDKFIKCFDINKLYLFTMNALFLNSKNYYDLYGKLDYTIIYIDSYKDLVSKIRLEDNFYNSFINYYKNDELCVYTIDDLFKDYDEFIKRVNNR